MIYIRTCWRWISVFFLKSWGYFLGGIRNLFCFMLPKNAGDSGGGLLDAVAKVCAGVNPMEVGGGGK